MSKEFGKYNKRGAYHWDMLSRNLRQHRPYLVARYQICLELLDEIKGLRIADLGCGDGALSGLIAIAGGDVVGIDPNKLGIELAREEFNKRGLNGTFYTDIEQVPKSSFDAVVCAEVIEHVDKPEQLLEQIYSLLKPDGIAIVSTPIRHTEIPLDHEHIQEFFPSEFATLCEKLFTVIVIKQELPLAAQEIFYYRSGILGRLHHLITTIQSAWFGHNYILNWKGLNRYPTTQFAKLKKSE